MAPVLYAMLALAAATPLTPVQKRTLARAVTCPDQLANDAARIRDVEHFYTLYDRFRPASHAGERMVYRDTVLRAKKCKPQDKALIHTFPES